MAILKQGNLVINGKPIAYEGKVKIDDGSITRDVFSQVNGPKLITSDVSSNVSTITIPIRLTVESREYFRSLINKENNIVISVGDLHFSGCSLEDEPDVALLEIGEYVFKGNPAF